MSKSKIQWTDETWNPIVGCTRVSEGCRNCYAFSLHDMRHEAYKNGKQVPKQYAKPFTEIQLMPDRLLTPLKRKKPTKWFVNSMSDLFHPDVPFEFIDKVFAVMALADRHIFQVLTKRPERAAEYLGTRDRHNSLELAADALRPGKGHLSFGGKHMLPGLPLENVWIGTSVEDQKSADLRIPHLLKCPAAVRFLSCEPLLSDVDIFSPMTGPCPDCGHSLSYHSATSRIAGCGAGTGTDEDPICGCRTIARDLIHWVIIGGESGNKARPCNVEWIRSMLHQCCMAGVPCFIKQLGSLPYTPHPGWDEPHEFNGVYDDELELRDSHGGDIDEWPDDLKVREFPK